MKVHRCTNKNATIITVFTLLLFIITITNGLSFIKINQSTHLLLHTILEMVSVIVTSAIFLYGWLTWNYTKSRILLVVSCLFFSVTIFDVLHILSFNGMPFKIAINIQIPTWFWILARLSEVFAILSVFLFRRFFDTNAKSKKESYICLSIVSVYALITSLIIFQYRDFLPILVVEGSGTTLIKNSFEYFFIVFHFSGIIYLWKKYEIHNDQFHVSLMFGFFFIIFCSLTFTVYESVHDTIQLVGHLYKVVGYFYILKAFYFTNVKDQFDEKRFTEKQLLRARRELKNVLLHHQGIMIKVVKIGDHFIYKFCDGKLLSKLGLHKKNIIGYSPYHFLEEELADKLHLAFEEVWNGEEGTLEFSIGDEIQLLMTTTRVVSEEGIVEIIGNIVDITETKQTEELLRRTEKLSIVGELAAGFAHEIRNPLTTVKGFLQLIKQSNDEKNKQYISIMLKEIDRLEMITNEFMIVAKPQATNYHHVNITNIVEDVVQFLTPQTLLKDIQIFTNILPKTIFIFGDEHQLKQVLINIYKNAMESMDKGGNILTELTLIDNHICISITDEGCGIPEEILPKLGEPFYTLKEKGTGLGLMVTSKIIQAHNGTIKITSKINVGTTVKIYLPVVSST